MSNIKYMASGGDGVLSAGWAYRNWGMRDGINATDPRMRQPDVVGFGERAEDMAAKVRAGKVALFDSLDEAYAASRKFSGKNSATAYSWNGHKIGDGCYYGG